MLPWTWLVRGCCHTNLLIFLVKFTHNEQCWPSQQQPPDRAVGSSSSTTNKLPLKPTPLPLPGRFETFRVSRSRLAMLAKSSLMPRPDFAEVSKYCAPTATA